LTQELKAQFTGKLEKAPSDFGRRVTEVYSEAAGEQELKKLSAAA